MIVGARLLQQSLSALLERQPDVRVVGACRPTEALAMVRARAPDVVVMELPHPGRTALSQVPTLMKLRPAPRIILVARDPAREDLEAALDLGVAALVLEEGGSEHLAEALAAVRRSERYVGPMIASILHGRAATAPTRGVDSEPSVVSLTPREREVLALIVQAKTERQIASELAVSPKTVHAHRTSIMTKLRAHNVIELVRRAIRLGLAEL